MKLSNHNRWERSGRVLDSRPRGRRFEPHQRYFVVSLSKNISPSLVLVQPQKTCPCITERLLMGRKESNQTNKQTNNKQTKPTTTWTKYSTMLCKSLKLYNNKDQIMFFIALTLSRSLGRCWEPRASPSVFNTPLWTWWMLQHGNPCLILICPITVKPVLSGHSKRRPKIGFQGRLRGAFCNTLDLH